MKLITKTAIASLVLAILPALATASQIKCPSPEFIKTQFADKLNKVTRIEVNKFVVKYWNTVTDEENHRWTVEIFADTTEDYDFNEAYQRAKYDLAHTVVRPAQPYTDSAEAYCKYLDQNESDSSVIALYQG